MIRARGGLHQLQEDWRLELVVGLYDCSRCVSPVPFLFSSVFSSVTHLIRISLMSKPSWFESTNDLSEISEHKIGHNILGSTIDLQKMRCLWLISFIQDMRNLMGMSSQLYMDGLVVFPSLYNAVLLILDDFMQKGLADKLQYEAFDYDRLACLFAISIMVQESVSLNLTGPINELGALRGLDVSLQASRDDWVASIYSLRLFLYGYIMNSFPTGEMKIEYITQMTDIIKHLSLEAHRGIEKCLINLLCGNRQGKLPFYVDDGGTPDSLLSSVRGN